jgi:SAM-dependent methyltransferase
MYGNADGLYPLRPMATEAAPAGDYRKYVGPPDNYDLMGGLQFALLLALGLREQHRLADVGCGSLRAGRLFIPYLAAGNYYGVEPNRWLVDAGIAKELGPSAVELKAPHFAWNDDFDLSGFGTQFDFVLAQSIFSHTFADLTAQAFRNLRSSLAPGGLVVATYYVRRRYAPGHTRTPDSGHGFLHPGVVGYRWPQIEGLLDDAGLAGHRVNWRHPRQEWFVAARKGDEAVLRDAVVESCRSLRALPRSRRARDDVNITLAEWRKRWRGQWARMSKGLGRS